MAGFTETHLGETDKPNEDVMLFDPAMGLALVADGVSRSREANGTYPPHSTVAPRLFADCMRSVVGSGKFGQELLLKGMASANQAIREVGSSLGVSDGCDYISRDYLGTTGLALSLDGGDFGVAACFAFIGDPLLFHVTSSGEVSLLTRDQLAACHQFGKPWFERLASKKNWSSQEAGRRRLIWQRRDVRNNPKARDLAGNPIGFGVLTGEVRALDFVETGLAECGKGDRFVLATDALRACAEVGRVESAESFSSIFSMLRISDPVVCAQKLIQSTRQAEESKQQRSDDATVVVVDIQ